jgi:isoleucyl-tRNA synthetase
VDQYVLVQLSDLEKKVEQSYEAFNFIDVSTSLIAFMTNTLSAFYMDYAKDILYIEKRDSLRRRQVQTVFWQCCGALIRLWAPILSFTAEEAYHCYDPQGESVFLTQFPKPQDYPNAPAIRHKWDRYMLIRKDILKALENAKDAEVIHKALEARIILKVKPEYADAVAGLTEHDLAQLVIASKVELSDQENEEFDTCWLKVERYDGHTCPRCWNVVDHVDEDGLCDRCHAILKG